MRAWLALLLALGATACESTRACREYTLYVAVRFDSVSADADVMYVFVTIDGMASASTQKQRVPGTTSGTLEIDFPGGYPAGHTVSVEVRTLLSGVTVGDGRESVLAEPKCTTLSLSVEATPSDRDAASD
jgi:hypothetical protein